MNTTDETKEFQKVVALQYEAIRRSGLTNMFDRHQVRFIAEENEFDELVEAIDDSEYGLILKNYSNLIMELIIDESEIPEVIY